MLPHSLSQNLRAGATLEFPASGRERGSLLSFYAAIIPEIWHLSDVLLIHTAYIGMLARHATMFLQHGSGELFPTWHSIFAN